MSDPVSALKIHQPQHDFLIAIDSDGCAFDTMELKHKECFIPNIIRYWDLQAVSKYARQAGEFVNLYSQWRGINRFPAVVMVFDLLADWDKVQARGVRLPEIPRLREWIATESRLGNPALEAYCAKHGEDEAPDMHQALRWSRAVNATVAEVVGKGLPPFPYVRETLEKAGPKADLMVCSATPQAALQEEWEGQGIAECVFSINGQEQGKKAEHIEMAAKGRYDMSKVLMVGDAPGDMNAARANGALFYPINPGEEDASWKRFHDEALDRFFDGTYQGDYEAARIAEFQTYLPHTPPWKA